MTDAEALEINAPLAEAAGVVWPWRKRWALVAVVFALVLLPSDRLSPRKLAAVLIGFAGVVVIMQPWESAGRPDLLGFGMTLVAGASYGLGWTYNRRFLGAADLGGLSMPTALLLVGSGMLLLGLVLSRTLQAA